jgi:transketolase
MRTLPNFVLFSPSDAVLCGKFVDYSLANIGPKYMRLDGKALPLIYDKVEDLKLEDGFYELIEGSEVCIVSTGYMTQKALRVAEALAAEGLKVGVIDVFLLKGLDEEFFARRLKRYSRFVTLEEGFINKGGLDSLVSLALENSGADIRIKRMGFGDAYVFEMGDREELHAMNGLGDEGIRDAIYSLIEKN